MAGVQSRREAGMVLDIADSSHLVLKLQAERDTCLVYASETPQPTSVIHLSQQGHTYNSRVTPTNFVQIVPLTPDQAFKHVRLWGPYSFKSQQCYKMPE